MPLTPYQHDLLDQPRAARETLRGLREQSIPESISKRLAQGEFRRVVLTGMGSSYHAFQPLYQALVRRGVVAYLVETSELLYTVPALLRADSLVVAASQSGRSAEIISLIARKEAGFTLVGVSNTPDSPLAQEADTSVLTRAGVEAAVSCKTYLSTLLALSWLEPALFGEPLERRLAELEAAGSAVEGYLAGWQAHVADLKMRLRGTQDLFITGRGLSLAAVGTGGLTTKESTHVHAEGMSSAAFRHGPMEMISPEIFVLVLEGRGAGAELNRRLYADIRSAGGSAGLVSENAVETVFRILAVPDALLPVVEILPVQMITLALADLRGHEAGRFTLGSKVTTVE